MPKETVTGPAGFSVGERAELECALLAAEETDEADVRAAAQRALCHLRGKRAYLDAADVRIAVAALGAILAEESSARLGSPQDAARQSVLSSVARKLTRMRMEELRRCERGKASPRGDTDD